jgi:AcrR family transcriptional regulator
MKPADSPPDPAAPSFPRLHGGPRQMSAERIARHQRRRLCRAMVELAGEQGYAKVTVRELVALAGVSRNVFYANFADKEECFWAAFEEIVAGGVARVEAAYRGESGLEARLQAGLQELVEAIDSDPASARFIFVDSLALGAASVEPRARAAARLEAMIGESLADRGAELREPVRKIRAVVGGIASVAYASLREGRSARLRESAADLFEWGMGYWRAQERGAAGKPSAGERVTEGLGEPAGGEQRGVAWEEPARSARSREELGQRERIMLGAAQVAAEHGYGALSIPAISAAAGVSNQTFYEHFCSAQEAFLAAFETMAEEVVEATAEAMADKEGWLEGVGAAVLRFMGCIVERPLFRELAFLQLPAAGGEGLDRAAGLLGGLTALLAPAELPEGAGRAPRRVAIEATAGGIWALLQGEIVEGRGEQVVERAAEIVDLVVIPFGIEE